MQAQPRVEAEEVRRADGAVGARDILRLVEQIGEREALLARHRDHVVETVLRIGLGIVRSDGDDSDADRREVAGVAHEKPVNGLHIRTVVADERNDRTAFAAQIGEAVGLAVDPGEGEGRRRPPEIADRLGFGHRSSFLVRRIGSGDAPPGGDGARRAARPAPRLSPRPV